MNVRSFATATLALCLSVAYAPRGYADRAAADFFTQRGDLALRDRKWADAQAQYRKALEAEETHALALLGLGEALLSGGDRADAIETWKRVSADAAGSPPAWVEGAARAKKRLAEVEAAAAALAQILDKRAEDLVSLAGRWAAKDAELAERSLRDALALRPDHARARELLAEVAPGGAPAAGGWVSLFDGTSLDGFFNPHAPVWTVAGGVIVGDLDIRGASNQTRSNTSFEGDFDVRVEARLVESYTPDRTFGICCALTSDYEKTFVGVSRQDLVLIEVDGPDAENRRMTIQRPCRGLSVPLDPTQWTTYEVQFRGDSVSVLVNGKLVETVDRAKNRDHGYVALLLQEAKVEFRKVEVLKR